MIIIEYAVPSLALNIPVKSKKSFVKVLGLGFVYMHEK